MSPKYQEGANNKKKANIQIKSQPSQKISQICQLNCQLCQPIGLFCQVISQNQSDNTNPPHQTTPKQSQNDFKGYLSDSNLKKVSILQLR